jgi:RHS repeat-associated protein
VRSVTGAGTTEFVFNAGGQRVSEWDGTTRAQLKGKYYWGSQPVAWYAPGGAAHFEHQDWEGTERLRTAYNGGVEGTFTSLPYGDAQAASGANGDAYHFAMLDSDTESGTDHAQFRQYSSTQGRWLSPDPYSGSYDFANPQSLNRYSHALNNPLSYVDPTGLYCVWDDGTHDEEPEEGGDDYATCVQDGGTWMDTASVTVDGNHPDSPGITIENGGQIYPQTIDPNNETPQQPMQPWYCGAGNSWSHPFTAPTAKQWSRWAAGDGLIGLGIAKYTKGTDPFSEALMFSSAIEAVAAAGCQ